MKIFQEISDQATRRPHAKAITLANGNGITYAELNRLIEHYSNLFCQIDGKHIGVCMLPSAEYIIAMLAIIHAGKTIVPLIMPSNITNNLQLANMIHTAEVSMLVFAEDDEKSKAILSHAITQNEVATATVGHRMPRSDSAAKEYKLDSNNDSTLRPSVGSKKPADSSSSSTETTTSLRNCDDTVIIFHTSGTTGTPKGVKITKTGLDHAIFSMRSLFSVSHTTKSIFTTSPVFDISYLEFLLALTAGGEVTIPTSNTRHDGYELKEKISEDAVNFLQLTPTALNLLRKSGWVPHKHLTLVVGGEYLPQESALWLCQYIDTFMHVYGPVEGSPWVLMSLIDKVKASESTKLDLGTSIGKTQIKIVDDRNRPVAIGEIGECHIAGPQLSSGYLNVKSDKFYTDSYGVAWYKTGDLMQRTEKGELEFCGRNDDQVKISGHRIEINGIENLLQTHPAVAQAAVITKTLTNADSVLVAYIVIHEPKSTSIRSLYEYLKNSVRDYEIPKFFEILPQLPVTSSNKVDRVALTRLPLSNISIETAYQPPTSKAEIFLVDILAKRLVAEAEGRELAKISVKQDVFAFGTDSLLANYLRQHIYEEFQKKMSVQELYSFCTIEAIAAGVDRKPKVLDKALPLSPDAETAKAHGHSPQRSFPLSSAQRRMYFEQIANQNIPRNNMGVALELFGTINEKSLYAAMKSLVERHETLRTKFTTVPIKDAKTGEIRSVARQTVIAPELVHFKINSSSFVGRSPKDLQGELQRLFKERIDIEMAPLFRVRLCHIDKNRYILYFIFHHIIMDGQSVEVFMRDLAVLYNIEILRSSPRYKTTQAIKKEENAPALPEKAKEEPSPEALPELQMQYKEYAQWEIESNAPDAVATKLAFWRKYLADAPDMNLALRDKSTLDKQHRGASVQVALPAETQAQLHSLAMRTRATPLTVYLAALSMQVTRYLRREDVIIGIPVDGRTYNKKLTDQIGFYVNLLAIRIKLEGSPNFLSLIKQLNQNLHLVFDNELPYDRIVADLSPERGLDNHFIKIALVFEEDTPAPHFENLTAKYISTESPYSIHQIVIFVRGNTIRMLYDTDLFDTKFADSFLQHFALLLRQVCSAPSQRLLKVSMLTSTEEAALANYNKTDTSLPQTTLVDAFYKSANEHPLRTALEHNNYTVSYQQLDQLSNALALRLVAHGLRQGDIVAIGYENQQFELYIGILAVLKAGAAYLPINHQIPPLRIEAMLTESDSKLLLTNSEPLKKLSTTCIEYTFHPAPSRSKKKRRVRRKKNDASATDSTDKKSKRKSAIPLANSFEAQGSKRSDKEKNSTNSATVDAPIFSDTRPDVLIKPEHLASVYFTSGTNKPKGVRSNHAGTCNLAYSFVKDDHYTSESRSLVSLNSVFDGFKAVLFPALASGATLVLVDEEHLLPANFTGTLKRLRITHATASPSALELARSDALPDLRVLITAGEHCSTEVMQKWAGSQFSFVSSTSSDDGDILRRSTSNIGNFVFKIKYGTTEADVCTTAADFTPESVLLGTASHLGIPIANCKVYILGLGNQPQPLGWIGEIYIKSPGFDMLNSSYGYLDPKEHSTHYLAHPVFGLLYKTGDRGQLTETNYGTYLVYRGRRDDQIERHGRRVELKEIEHAISTCRGVNTARVCVKQTATSSPSLTAYVSMSPDSHDISHERILTNWQVVCDAINTHAKASVDPTFNPSGFDSRFDNAPIPPAEMEEWASQYAQTLASFKPRKVLELGAGLGLVLFKFLKLYSKALTISVSDISPSALSYIQEQRTYLDRVLASKIRYAVRPAHVYSPSEHLRYDCIYGVSVSQYFPDADYLQTVLRQAIRHSDNNAKILIGDVRDLRYHSDLLLEVLLFSNTDRSPKQWMTDAHYQCSKERELLIHPAFFERLFDDNPGIYVEVSQSEMENELGYRLNIVFHKTSKNNKPNIKKPVELECPQTTLEISHLLSQMHEKEQDVLIIDNIPDARRAKLAHVLSTYESHPTTGHLRKAYKNFQPPKSDLSPKQLREIANQHGLQVLFPPCEKSRRHFAMIVYRNPEHRPYVYQLLTRSPAWRQNRMYNDPKASMKMAALQREIYQHLTKTLENFKHPDAIMILPGELPRNQSGKFDRHALPTPESARLSEAIVPPQTKVEKALHKAWCGIVGATSDQIGIHCRFSKHGSSFDFVHLKFEIDDKLQCNLSYQDFLNSPTIAQLASVIDVSGDEFEEEYSDDDIEETQSKHSERQSRAVSTRDDNDREISRSASPQPRPFM